MSIYLLTIHSGCVITIIRLHALSSFGISLDPTWDYTVVVIWTGAELAAGMVCASLPAVRQLLTLPPPKRWSQFLTNQSRNQIIPMPDRGQTPSANRQQKGLPSFPLPSFSRHSKSLYRVTTDISSSSWSKSQAKTVQDIERGHVADEAPKGSFCLLLQPLFHSSSCSTHTSFWSSVGRSGTPPLDSAPTHPPHITGFQALSSRTQSGETTGKASVDSHVELLRGPNSTYWANSNRLSVEDDITALPRPHF